jgi:hypothetical protein
MAVPPFDAGAAHEMSADWESLPATTFVGWPGTVDGVAYSGADGVPSPIALSARTAMEYWVPFVSPVIVKLEPSVPAETKAPLLSEYSTPVIGEPPLFETVAPTVIAPSAGVRVTTGALGTAAGATSTVVDASDSPTAFRARISIG